jgi:hypothetical protein
MQILNFRMNGIYDKAISTDQALENHVLPLLKGPDGDYNHAHPFLEEPKALE